MQQLWMQLQQLKLTAKRSPLQHVAQVDDEGSWPRSNVLPGAPRLWTHLNTQHSSQIGPSPEL